MFRNFVSVFNPFLPLCFPLCRNACLCACKGNATLTHIFATHWCKSMGQVSRRSFASYLLCKFCCSTNLREFVLRSLRFSSLVNKIDSLGSSLSSNLPKFRQVVINGSMVRENNWRIIGKILLCYHSFEYIFVSLLTSGELIYRRVKEDRDRLYVDACELWNARKVCVRARARARARRPPDRKSHLTRLTWSRTLTHVSHDG